MFTMYRLMLYFLLALLGMGAVFGQTGHILATAGVLVVVTNISNVLLARAVGAKPNLESATITGLIIALITGPFDPLGDIGVILFLALVAMLSKYALVWRRRHIFNPAAASVLVSALVIGEGASWWVGSRVLLPIILIGGVLVVRQINRVSMVLAFGLFYAVIGYIQTYSVPTTILPAVIWFFALVMLVEPMTSPTGRWQGLSYGAFVGVLASAQPVLFPRFQFGLESALLTSNMVFAFIAPRANYVFKLLQKTKLAPQTWRFDFSGGFTDFAPGQYMEWTLPHKKPDKRGFRRFFTISSSPADKNISITTKIFNNSSSFKKALLRLGKGDKIQAHGPAGDFVLPEDKSEKLAFIAGGIGVTPFVSMSEQLKNKDESRDIVLLYVVTSKKDIAFNHLFEKTIINERKKSGHVDSETIKEQIPDYKDRVFYLSGPTGMIKGFKKLLGSLGVKKVKTDYFPGY